MITLRARLIDEQTKEYRVLNQIEALRQDVPEVELDISYDGRFYAAGYAPAKPQSLIDQEEIAELKAKLSASDYAVIKIAEGAAQPEEYAELISQRQEWRTRINELEAALLAAKEPQEPETPAEKPQEEAEETADNE